MLPRQNVTRQNVTRENVIRQSVTRQNFNEPPSAIVIGTVIYKCALNVTQPEVRTFKNLGIKH